MTPDLDVRPLPTIYPRWQRVSLAAIAFFLLALAGLAVSRYPGNVAMLWLANAFGLGILLHQRSGDALWQLAGMLVAGLAANAAMGDSPVIALALALGNVAEIAFSAWLVRAMTGGATLSRPGPLARFALTLGAASTLGPAVGATIGAATISTAYHSGFGAVWWTWWTADSMGIVMLLPLMVSITRERFADTFRRAQLPRFAGLLLLSLAVGGVALYKSNEPFVVMALPLVLAALLTNPFATALLTLLAICGTVALGLVTASLGLGANEPFVLQSVQLSTALIMVFPVCIAFLLEQNRRDRSELRGSERRFRQAMEHSAIGMALVGLDGRWLQVNRAICDLLGYDAAELAELPFPTITHPDDLVPDLHQVERLLAGEIESYRIEKRYRHKDGRYRWALLAVSLVHDENTGKPLHFISQVEDIDERKAALEKLEALSRRTQLAVEAGGVGIWEWDVASGAIEWDARMHALHGVDPALGAPDIKRWTAMVHPEDVEQASTEMREAVRGTRTFDTEYRIQRPDGAVRHIRAMAMVLRQDDGTAVSMIGTNWDITEQRRLTEALFEEKERLHITLRSIGDAVICTDATMGVTFMNPIAEQLTGWTMQAAAGQPLESIFRIVDEHTNAPIPSPVEQCLLSLRPVYLQDGAVLQSLTGDRHDVQDSAAPVRTATGEVIGAVLVFQDITGARALQRELAHSASHDALTGLPNRIWFEKRLREACEAARMQQQHHALCFIDLDRFKIVNDTAGHAAGDVLLRELGHVIRYHVRPDDLLAGLGGDEFALLLMDCTVDHAERVCQKIIDAIRGQRFPWEGRVYDVGASIGITAIDHETPPMGELMSRADVACYAAKAAGRSRVSVYRRDESDAQRHHQELQVAAGIHSALDANRFRLFAQEIRALQRHNQAERHIEILVRMVDEQGKLVMPGAFIPAAERYDLMGHVDRWVIHHVLHEFGERLTAVPKLTVAINLSANSLGEPFLLPFLHAELHESVLPASRIQLEITETALINNMAAANRLVTEMRSAGCTVALDDFGAGLSSFSYLKQFPVDYLKIDGSFIRHLAGSAVDREIVSSINDIGHRLGMLTVAESVEDEETLQALRSLGVDYAQGYVIGRPMPLELFLESCPTQPVDNA
ncbi:diguanylate cyclase [Cupriavidus basilensis]|uniref:diguanylate cyclase n=1 Tax=Cupriavidus basilensis TaxID=68895 RepID=UPI00284A82C5|nr:diguanylate cyclase [Cupriavidus basilensis]MDR3384712.1 diguanylate cyclase [Cupriavidus basilensis]